ncbi:DUF5304 domain-containing protein [Streptomyces sp. NPDC051776]|uniref:DUF5304 domain-containing protein n=1 Tax=Streptomyces sp. NPDC051776 TaxID=3155414 RepID=UPI0034160B6C
MSDATKRPGADPAEAPQADAWAKACAEDLAAERARRRAQYGAPTGSAADELRKLADAVAERLSSIQVPNAGATAAGAVQQLIAQAKAAVEPVVERNPQVFDHLAAAGSELLAAYRAVVEGQERRWTRSAGTPEGPRGTTGPDGPDGPEGPSGTERIDLD